jgi:hypothetical protein
MARSPRSAEAFFAEVDEAAGADARLDSYVAGLRHGLTDLEGIEARARRVVEHMALALQGSLLVRFGDPAVADAFCASRLGGEGGRAFGTLPPGTDFARIVERHAPQAKRRRRPRRAAPPEGALIDEQDDRHEGDHEAGREADQVRDRQPEATEGADLTPVRSDQAQIHSGLITRGAPDVNML